METNMTIYIAVIGILIVAVFFLFIILRKQQKELNNNQKQDEMWQKIVNLEAKNSALESEKSNLRRTSIFELRLNKLQIAFCKVS